MNYIFKSLSIYTISIQTYLILIEISEYNSSIFISNCKNSLKNTNKNNKIIKLIIIIYAKFKAILSQYRKTFYVKKHKS